MKKLSVVVLWVCLGCGGVGSSGSGDLSETECRELLAKITEVSYQDLSASERAEVEETEEKRTAAAEECVREKTWQRAGYDCVMQASSMNDLRACILKND